MSEKHKNIILNNSDSITGSETLSRDYHFYNDSLKSDIRSSGNIFTEIDGFDKTSEITYAEENNDYIKGIPREGYIFNNDIVTTMIIICFLLFAYCYSTSSKFIERIFTEIFENTPRKSFTVESTLTLLRLKGVMLIVTFIIEGMGFFYIYDTYIEKVYSDISSFIFILSFGCFFFTVYLIQVIILRLIGFIFSNKIKIKLLVQGLTNTTIVLGLSLILPVLIAIYYSLSLKTFLMIVIILYLITRMRKSYKGSRSVYNGWNRLVELNMYVCDSERRSKLV